MQVLSAVKNLCIIGMVFAFCIKSKTDSDITTLLRKDIPALLVGVVKSMTGKNGISETADDILGTITVPNTFCK